MKVAVVGSRNFNDKELIYSVLDNLKRYYKAFEKYDLIISGGAVGTDNLAEGYANENKIKTQIFIPDYIKHLQGAPIRRNLLIVKEAELIVLFWDGKSKGSKNVLTTANKLNKPVIQVDIGTGAVTIPSH